MSVDFAPEPPGLWEGALPMTVTGADGVELEGEYLLPEGEPRGIVQIMHGMNEHLGRYEETAHCFRDAGWVIAGHAMRGHGSTAGCLDNLLHFADRGGWVAAVGDVLATARELRELFPGLPLVWMGHSLGSFMVRDAAALFCSVPDAIIVLGTVGPPHGVQPLGRVLGGLQAALLGPSSRANLINTLHSASSAGSDEHEWLTRDAAARWVYATDPWTANVPTAQFFVDIVTGLQRISRPETIGGLRRDLPVLIASGSTDELGRGGEGPRWLADAYRRTGMRDVTLLVYEGARHELLQEINRDEVRSDILDWMEAHVPRRGRGPDIP